MKKILSLLAFMLITFSYAYAGDALYKTLTFPDGNNASVGSYTTSWTATCDGMTWHLRNFNNNKNGWAYVKCGRKDKASVGEIFTEAVSEKISKVVVKLDASLTKPEYVNATYLEIATDTMFTSAEKVAVDMNNTEITYAVVSPKANMCYRLIYDCKGASANGIVVIKSVELYKVDASTLSEPAFSPVGSTYYEPQQVSITSAEGADIYYSFDNSSFTKYTSPIALASGDIKTIYAYADNGSLKSGVKSSSYKIAKSYASLDELIAETPTAEGWPVIVPFTEEEIASFYGGADYRNGVYLTRMANGKNFELYCKDAPMTWNIGDKISGTAKGIYQDYNGQWEISLVSWDGITNSTSGVQAPTITFDAATKTVTIADPSGNNNTIFYTTDGTEPDDSKNLYEAPFTIAKTTTVKAVCYDDLDEKSGVATMLCEIEGDALKTCAELNTNCVTTEGINITFEFTDLIVTAANGQYVFVKDATGSFLLFKSSTYKKGDKLSGSVKGKLYLYNGVKELAVNDWNSV
ncbi:MAG: chitobiase/beta-hexosaminidase C-terminal domain-containing protein, partial [Prevotellaceae bacterium]|nr:chitobiase/beta-hexosaminidase C-terminal domain-containing protein [Prevotellaceae bacterium]